MRRLVCLLLVSACAEPVVGFALPGVAGGGEQGGGNGYGAGGGIGGGTAGGSGGGQGTGGGTAGGGSTGDCTKSDACCTDFDCPDSGNPCTTRRCTALHTCVYENNDAGCDDGRVCTAEDHCVLGVCQGTSSCRTPGDCDTLVTCATTCQFTHKGAGAACTDDGNPCTADLCDGDGGCGHWPVSQLTACASDNNDCTTDRCDGDGGCAHAALANQTPCATDNMVCTRDVCLSGSCAHPLDCASAPVCHTTVGASCSGTGACLYPALTAGTACVGSMPPIASCEEYRCSNGATCVANDLCTGGGMCTASGCACSTVGYAYQGGACVPCSNLNNGACGRNPQCDTVTVDVPEGGGSPVIWPSGCTSSPPACNSTNAYDGNLSMYNAGVVSSCVKRNGGYTWLARHSSMNINGPGCLVGDPHCTFICTAKIAYSAYCSAASNWEQNLAGAGADGCGPFPTQYQCP